MRWHMLGVCVLVLLFGCEDTDDGGGEDPIPVPAQEDYIMTVCTHPKKTGRYDSRDVSDAVRHAVEIWMRPLTVDTWRDRVPSTHYDLMSILAHELGHAVGIRPHLPLFRGVMQEHVPPGPAGRQRALSDADLKLLAAVPVTYVLEYIGRTKRCDVKVKFEALKDSRRQADFTGRAIRINTNRAWYIPR